MSERITYFVDVILPLSIPNTYTYRVPFELNEEIDIGKRVIVPFGRAKYYTAIVKDVHEEVPKNYTVKYVEAILDDYPIVTDKQFQLWDWIAEYYLADLGDVMNAALPSNFKLASETKLSLHPEFDRAEGGLSDKEFLILEALQVQDELTLKEVAEIVQIKTIQPLIKSLIDKKCAIVSEELNAKYAPKYSTFVEIDERIQSSEELSIVLNELEQSSRNEKQVAALLKLVELSRWQKSDQRAVLRRELVKEGISESSLNSLAKKEIVDIYAAEVSRLEAHDQDIQEQKAFSDAQQIAYEEINASFTEKDVVLLHGVTSSGKTEIYVQKIQEAIDKGQQVLFLLPEIALTTQLINRLRKYFGDLVGVYHSKFNQNERIEIWNKVLQNDPNQFRIILGARSSVFLPFRDLGLIIVDEEHENSFKQYDPSPRYNARDIAIILGRLHRSKVLLGSATPSIESYFNAKENRYGLVTLTERFGGVKMPEIQCADLEKETKQKTMKSHFSSFLLENMETALEAKEQIILFQNRRGYTPLWTCEMCGWTPHCKNCDVSLTYHKSTSVLKCHYCGYYISPPSSCGACGSRKLKMIGFGTEKIEDELAIYFPEAKLQRMDLDTTRAKHAYSQIISDFENKEVDILIGTQMVTKGLDFDNVGLVGILSADQLLNFPDFRAFERAYHLMSQVAGRAGRKQKRGKVVVQTYEPNHWIIQKVMQHDYEGFYTQEILERRNFHYPPFFRIVVLKLRHKKIETLEVGAASLAKSLQAVFKDRVLGPEVPLVSRVRNYYLKNITLKFERDASAKKVKDIVKEKIDLFLADHDYRSIRIDIDVDPQ
ncbi:primosomal protein N' [Paracrocinitomix mangrovi]|uniref:replication restart helicase PriA n=1 Tax=Paracrocinitomix mangrovi TaxID=2862509 RepID=UPI001C8DC289|nr:primosomal protein N' [Paracrocinitomix mangrovi]UKN01810.1 primosomal protein N' [Paracrocinitomix mangrovi]